MGFYEIVCFDIFVSKNRQKNMDESMLWLFGKFTRFFDCLDFCYFLGFETIVKNNLIMEWKRFNTK